MNVRVVAPLTLLAVASVWVGSTTGADDTLPATAPLDSSLSPAPGQPAVPSTPSSTLSSTPSSATSEKPEPTSSDTQPPPAEPQADASVTAPPPVIESARQDSPETRAESVVQAKRERGVPYYQLTRPNWGIQVNGSANALGDNALAVSQGDAPTRALEIQAELQPAFLQSIGVLGIGPSIALYPIFPLGSVTPAVTSIWSFGGQIRYQARFFREQALVPMGGFEIQYLKYAFTDISGSTTISGPFVGGMLLLNFLEPSSASEMYITQGISRSYLVAELKMLTGSDGQVSIAGQALFFGLRFEF